MRYFQLLLELRGPGMTPWQADTLFGSLCWMVAQTRGEDALRKWLAPFRQRQPPFLLSDGFPGDLLPAPLVLAAASTTDTAGSVAAYDRVKRRKRQVFVTPDDFAAICRGEIIDPVEVATGLTTESRLHNTINRCTGTTADEGSLYELEEFRVDEHLSVYLAADDEATGQQVLSLIERLARAGYGKKKSAGYGAFAVREVRPWVPPALPAPANGFVTLAGFVPAVGDPVAGWWRYRVKYGKLGEERATQGAPFKRPFLCLEPGACFRTGGTPGTVYGQMLDGLAPAYPDVFQYAFAFPVPLAVEAARWEGTVHGD